MESIGDLGTSLLLQHVVSSGSSQIFPMTRQSKFFSPKVIQKYIDTFTKVESKFMVEFDILGNTFLKLYGCI